MRLHNYLLVVAIMGVSVRAQACDICGCGSGGSSLGLLPMLQRNLTGMRWQMQSFDSKPHGSGLSSSETFRTLDVWGRWQLHRRVQLMAMVPYTINDRTYQDGSNQHTAGLGDASLLVHISLFSPVRQSMRTWQHALQIGGGIKLPTGRSNLKDSEDKPLLIQIQPGSGSTDAVFSGFYALRKQNWGISVDASLQLRSANKDGYQLGNRLNNNLRFFMLKKVKKTAFMPHLGLMSEMSDMDRIEGKTQTESGGKSLFSSIGLDVFRGKFVLGIGGQLPLAHHQSNGLVTPHARFNAAATYLFGGKRKAAKIDVPAAFQDVKKSTN